ncbi:hypothetical protein CNEO4_340041 [Clostridium neonatale]|nr:hypothetical protein CNEO4_340041 [Clostridium neonatale]
MICWKININSSYCKQNKKAVLQGATPKQYSDLIKIMVPVTGVEPVRYRYHWILSPARLPIPSHRHAPTKNILA